MEGSYNGAAINIVAGNVTVTNNTISNIANYSVYTSAATRTLGIFVQGGTANITANIIHDIKSTNTVYGTAPAYTGSNPAGIFISTASTNAVNIEANQIYNIFNISNSATANTSNGITISGGICTIHRNRIYNVFGNGTGVGAASPYSYGIFLSTSGHMIKNNQISLGLNATGESQVFGIEDVSASGTNSIFYNSIFISGRTNSGANNSYCIQRTSTVNDIVWNNIFYNKRTTLGTGSNLASGASNATGITSSSINYNLMLVSDTSKIAELPLGVANGISSFNGLFNPITYNTNWMDLTSNVPSQLFFTDTSVGNLGIINTNSLCWYANGKAIALAGVSGDYASAATSRSVSISSGSSDIGSVEFSTSSTPLSATASASPAASTTTYYSFANRQIASVSWGSVGTAPSVLDVKYYSGTNAPNLVSSKTQFNSYASITPTGGSGYNYTLSIIYDSATLGNVASSSNARLALYAGTSWSLYTGSLANPSTGMLQSVSTSSTFGNFTGTDNTNPLPIFLLEFRALLIDKDVKLNWTTSSEINNNGFEVERSNDGNNFEKINFARGNGTTNTLRNYEFIDVSAPLDKTNVIYYRLKQIDFDGKFEYSKIIYVSKNQPQLNSVFVHPNPFVNTISISFASDNLGKGIIVLTDITGRKISAKEIEMTKGINSYELNETSSLQQGIYFIRLTENGNTSVSKIIKVN
jgi:hypothetical protein